MTILNICLAMAPVLAAIVYTNGKFQLDGFVTSSELDGKQCQAGQRAFQANGTTALYCIALCHSYSNCRSVFFNGENAVCEGCIVSYDNATGLTDSVGTDYFREMPEEFSDTDYLLHSFGKMTFYDAKELCKNISGYLLQVDSEAENQFIAETYGRNESGYAIWIGITDENQEGVWEWVTYNSTTNYTNWKPSSGPGGIPRPDENCAAMIAMSNYLWSDRDCNRKNFAVCELYE